MSLWVCSGCSTAYAVGLPKCPQCGSEEYEEAGMPKITKHGGPSNANEEESWPGNSSSTSTDETETTSKKTSSKIQSPAPSTESPSKQDRTEGSSASSTGGGQTAKSSPAKKSASSKSDTK